MNDLLLVLTGAGISLASSVTVTWLQFRYTRRSDLRTIARTSARQLTGLFIAERDTPADTTGEDAPPSLAEAEMLSVAIADRRTRERVRSLIRLLRELRLPELQELSGLKPERARQLLCDHALDVLGAHLRGERVPALPQAVQKMLNVENEALTIRAGGSPASGGAGAPTTTGRKGRRRPRGTATAEKATDPAATDEAEDASAGDTDASSFWKD